MTDALYVVGFALIVFAIIRHERRVFLLNRNSSWFLSEAQKKAPPREREGMGEYGGTRLP